MRLLYEEETPTDVISVAAGLLGAVVAVCAVCAGMVTRGRALREARNQEGEDPEIELSLPQTSTPNLELGGGERRVTRVTRMAYSPSLWLMAIGW